MATAFLFPGLNALKRIKDRQRYLIYPEVIRQVVLATAILNERHGVKVNAKAFLEKSESELYSNHNIGITAVYNTAIQVGITNQLRGIIADPDMVMGYSQGDIARSVCARILDIDTALTTVYQFFYSFEKGKAPGESLGIRAQAKDPFSTDDFQWFSDMGVEFSLFTPRYLLCSCTPEVALLIRKRAENNGWYIGSPFFNFPVHSKLLRPFLNQVAQKVLIPVFHLPSIPVYSTILNQLISQKKDLEKEVHTGLYSSVNWLASIHEIVEKHKITTVVNIGPCRSIALMLRETPIRLKVLDADKLLMSP